MINFSMDDPEYNKPGFFNPPFQAKTYLNIIFSFFLILSVSVSFVVLLTLFLMGTLLIVIWIGVPVLNLCFHLSTLFAGIKRHIYNLVYDKNIPSIEPSTYDTGSQLTVFYSNVKNFRCWRYLLFHIVELPVGIIGVLISGLLLLMLYLLVYTPFKAMFGEIYFLGFQTVSYIEAVIFFFVGLFLIIGVFNLVNYWTEIHLKLVRRFLSR